MILLISPPTAYATKRLLQEGGSAVRVMSLADLAAKNFNIDPKDFDAVFIRSPFVNGSPEFFPQIISLAQKFKLAGKRVVDKVIAEGELGQGKMSDYIKLKNSGISIPATEWFAEARECYFPCIAKWTYGFGGKEVFLLKSQDDLLKVIGLIPAGEMLIQEFIPAECEYKVFTVGYKALAVILKFKIDSKIFRPDFGDTEVIRLPSNNENINQLVQIAESASKTLNRELSKVDILEFGGKFYVLEVNRWPGLKSFEELTGFNVAGEFIKYLIK